MLASRELEDLHLRDRPSPSSLVREALPGLSSSLLDELCALAERHGVQAVLDLLRSAEEVILERTQELQTEVEP